MKKNSMWGYVNLKPGGPTKKKPIPKLIPSPEPSAATDAWSHKNKDPPASASSRKEKLGKYTDYKNPACKASLDVTVAACIASLRSGVSDKTNSDMVGYLFPEATTRRKIHEARSTDEGGSGDGDKKPKAGILLKEQCVFLSDISEARDLSNNGIYLAEMISLIMQMSGTANCKHAENHYNCLIRAGNFPT